MLWLGIGATVGANIAFGAGYGLLGALISAWPAVAFIGAVEIAMQQVRRARGPRAAISGPAVPAVPGDVEQAVRAAYAASVAAGQPLSQRAMAERFGLSRRRVSQLAVQARRPGGKSGLGRYQDDGRLGTFDPRAHVLRASGWSAVAVSSCSSSAYSSASSPSEILSG